MPGFSWWGFGPRKLGREDQGLDREARPEPEGRETEKEFLERLSSKDEEIARLRGQAEKLREHLVAKNGQIEKTNQRLHKLREHVEKKDARIERQQRDLQQADRRAASAEERAAGLCLALSRARGDGLSPALSESGTPVFFMVGRGRSGTTWLQNTLNAHPEILCKGEGRFFDREFRRDDYKDVEVRNAPVASLYNAIRESEYLRLWVERRPVWSRGREVEEHLDNLARLAIDYFLAEQLSRSGKRIVGDKTPFAWEDIMTDPDDLPGDDSPSRSAEVLEEIGRLYPEAKVIHVIRDGRDVAVSTMHFMWNLARSEGGLYPLRPEELDRRDRYREDPSLFAESLFADGRLASLARGWSIEVGRAVERGPALLGDRYAEVRYEDLLLQPESELGRLLGFLGADAGGAGGQGVHRGHRLRAALQQEVGSGGLLFQAPQKRRDRRLEECLYRRRRAYLQGASRRPARRARLRRGRRLVTRTVARSLRGGPRVLVQSGWPGLLRCLPTVV